MLGKYNKTYRAKSIRLIREVLRLIPGFVVVFVGLLILLGVLWPIFLYLLSPILEWLLYYTSGVLKFFVYIIVIFVLIISISFTGVILAALHDFIENKSHAKTEKVKLKRDLDGFSLHEAIEYFGLSAPKKNLDSSAFDLLQKEFPAEKMVKLLRASASTEAGLR